MSAVPNTAGVKGEAVMSARYFPQGKVSFSLMGLAEVTLQHWPLARCVVE